MGSIVIGTVVGYTWFCDKCDRPSNERLDRLLRTGESITVAIAKGTVPDQPSVGAPSDENWDSPPVISSPVLNDSGPQDKDVVNPEVAVNLRPVEPRGVGDARCIRDATRFSSCEPYVLTLRGTVLPKDVARTTAARTWHGQ